MKLVILAALISAAVAFVASPPQQHAVRSNTCSNTALNVKRRDMFGAAAAGLAAACFAPLVAFADREYENVPFLGGSNVVDINNANVRVYLKMPGLYPTIAGKIVANGPYKSVGDVYNIPGLSGKEKDLIKKYESRFVAKTPSPEYVIDRFNNGLYR